MVAGVLLVFIANVGANGQISDEKVVASTRGQQDEEMKENGTKDIRSTIWIGSESD